MRSRKSSGNIWIEAKLLESKAYFELNGKAAKVLMWFLKRRQFAPTPGSKRQDWMQINNGEIVFTYNEAEKKYGINRQTFSKLLDDLVEKGFIDVSRPGIGSGKMPTLFSISQRWRKYGTPEFEVVKRKKRLSHRFSSGKDHPIHKKLMNRELTNISEQGK